MQYRPHRYPTEFPVDVRTPIGAQRVHVTDVNVTGAALKGVDGLERGHKLAINLLSHHVEGVVRWVHGDKVGVAFRPQISEDQLDTLRYRRDGRNVFRPGSIGYRNMEMR